MTTKFEQASRKYKPLRIKFLLVAEAPPREDSDRFFYFEDVSAQDSLFLETMKLLYPGDYRDTKFVRANKATFLRRFMNDGFYLIDSCDTPIIDPKNKKPQIMSGLPLLRQKISDLIDGETKIILISKNVYEVCFDELKINGYNVINKEMIDFPGSGGQTKYKNKMSCLLKNV